MSVFAVPVSWYVVVKTPIEQSSPLPKSKVLRTHYGQHYEPFSVQNALDCRTLQIQSQKKFREWCPRIPAEASPMFGPRYQCLLGWPTFTLFPNYETTAGIYSFTFVKGHYSTPWWTPLWITSRAGLGRLAAWHLPVGPVGPASMWTATPNVKVGQTTYSYAITFGAGLPILSQGRFEEPVHSWSEAVSLLLS